MAHCVEKAEIELTWDNGVKTKIGTLSMEYGKVDATARINVSRQRIGWNLVQMGFKLMFPRRKWEERWKDGDGDGRQAADQQDSGIH